MDNVIVDKILYYLQAGKVVIDLNFGKILDSQKESNESLVQQNALILCNISVWWTQQIMINVNLWCTRILKTDPSKHILFSHQINANSLICTVYPKKYAHGFCFAVLCCGYTLTDFHISIRLTSLALWQSNDCPSASKATLMNMDKYFMWIHYEQLHNHNKAKHNKTVCIFLGINCIIDDNKCFGSASSSSTSSSSSSGTDSRSRLCVVIPIIAVTS